jgi:hypothetical protein
MNRTVVGEAEAVWKLSESIAWDGRWLKLQRCLLRSITDVHDRIEDDYGRQSKKWC